MKNHITQFNEERNKSVASNGENKQLLEAAGLFNYESNLAKYSYNFSWMGRPIIAYPQDMIAMQELIWDIKPDLIIETGVAHGGSIIYYASLLELIGNNGLVVGIDIDIRKHNRDLIEAHPMMKRIQLIEGPSTSESVINQVKAISEQKNKIMVCLDSNHTHEHVLEELKLYAPLTSPGSYCIVFDTIVEYLPDNYLEGGRPWGVGNNPKTAVLEYLNTHDEFEVDKSIDNKVLISVAPGGYLKRIR